MWGRGVGWVYRTPKKLRSCTRMLSQSLMGWTCFLIAETDAFRAFMFSSMASSRTYSLTNCSKGLEL